MTNNDIIENLENQLFDLYYTAQISEHNEDKHGQIKALREAEAVHKTGIRLLPGDKWAMRLDDARSRAIDDAFMQYSTRYDTF